MALTAAVDGFRLAYDDQDDWFADAQVRPIDGAGHFTPLEAPEAYAAAALECGRDRWVTAGGAISCPRQDSNLRPSVM
jgi:pimeloyl-ACP methyl ester carboxylesterase